MRSVIVPIVAAAMLALGSTGVFAGDKHGHDRHGQRHGQHDRASGHQHRGAPGHGSKHWDKGHRHAPVVRYAPPRHAHPHHRGAGPRHDIYAGARLPVYYSGYPYVVQDWRVHRLAPPRRGYHWVQVGADYVLVAVATGIITQILLAQ